MVRYADLKQWLRYDLVTGEWYWLVNKGMRAREGQQAGSFDDKGYLIIKLEGRRYRAHRLAWLYVKGIWPVQDIDHRDGNPANCRWLNLRLATAGQNRANSKPTSRAGLKGVQRKGNRWQARIRTQGKLRYLGTFETSEAAANAYMVAATQHHGEFARSK